MALEGFGDALADGGLIRAAGLDEEGGAVDLNALCSRNSRTSALASMRSTFNCVMRVQRRRMPPPRKAGRALW
jgi:hypothetical protein